MQFFKRIQNTKGQSIVEYIMLLAVVMSLSMAVIKSDQFQLYMGPKSPFFAALRNYFSYTYRHGQAPPPNKAERDDSGYSAIHGTYFDGSQTKFFTPADAYP